MKRISFNITAFILGAFLFGLFELFHVQGTPSKYDVLENPQQLAWVETDQEYNAIVVEFLDGQDEAVIHINSPESAKHFHLDPDDESERFSHILVTPYSNKFYISSEGRVNLHLYNSKKRKNTFFAGTKYVEGLRIISREEWGADETIRYDYDSNGDYTPSLSARQTACQANIDKYPEEYTYKRVITSEKGNALIWPRQYSKKVQRVVVHHTAESDKSRNIPGGDKIRSVYYYHAVTRGWGDIGYHFLIDQDGKIYEGRAGGDYVVGAHVFCNNINTIGVSLMGNFQRNQATKKQIASLTKLLNALGKKYDIDLSKTSKFHGEKGDNLIGHRDLGSTACPGDNMYALLPTFRKYFSVADLDFSINQSTIKKPASAYGAKLSGNPTVIEMEPAEKKKITLTYKNTGTAVWDKTTWLYAAGNDNKKLWTDSIILSKDYVAANLRESKVYPGNFGHFDIEINTGITGGTHTLELTPIINGERKMNAAATLLAVKVPEVNFDYEFVNAKHAQNPFYYGQFKEAKVFLKNTGTTTWKRSGDFAVTLAPPNGKTSPFASTDNPDTLAWMEQSEVKPGKTATFTFEINGGFTEGIYDLPFVPRIGKDTYMDNIGMKFTIQVKEPNYRAQILYENKDLVFRPGETKTIRLGLRNQSNVDWQENQVSLRVMYNGGLKFQETNFYFPETIEKNATGFIPLNITAPLKAGSYKAKFQILANDKKFNNTRFIELPVKVEEAELKGDITHVSTDSIPLKVGKVENLVMRIKNTGNITWKKEGANAIRLTPVSPNSRLRAPSWKSKSIVAYMENKEVPTGKVATFRFQLKVNNNEALTERFRLRTKSLGTVQGSEFEVSIVDSSSSTSTKKDSNNSSKSSSVSSSREALLAKLKARREQLKSGSSNTSTNTSTKSRREILLEKLKAKREALKSSSDKTSSTNSSKTTTTKKETTTPVADSGKNIRVLLSFPHSSANVLSPGRHKVTVDGNFFMFLGKGDSLWTRQEKDKMIVSVNGNKDTGNVIRVEPVNNTEYLTLFNWNRSPAWNPDINDNTFEGALEFRLVNGQVVVINDLDMEAYLRGMAEVPEAQPHEKRKAMAILARSYARHYTETEYKKFPGLPYDGSDSPAVFQKYLGHNYSLRSPNWQKALQETKNVVITYDNEILRTAYFSCSNGTTKTPSQASWNSKYFKKVRAVYESVDDSYGKDTDKYNKGLCGHGVGLSGKGAEILAKRGRDYKYILNYYYQDIKLVRRK